MFHESTSAYRRLHVQVNYFRIADESGAIGKTLNWFWRSH